MVLVPPVCAACSASVALLSNQFCLSCLQHFFTSSSFSLYSLKVASVFLPRVSDCFFFAFSTLLSSVIFHVLGEIQLSLLSLFFDPEQNRMLYSLCLWTWTSRPRRCLLVVGLETYSSDPSRILFCTFSSFRYATLYESSRFSPCCLQMVFSLILRFATIM